MVNYFAPRFKELRLKHGLTKKQMAQILHCSPQTVAKYEKGLSFPKLYIVARTSEYFKISVNYLIGYEENFKQIKK